jgi:hypothetical protein
LTVYAFARRPHIDAQLFLGNVNLRSEIGGEGTESPRQPDLEGQQDGLFDAVADPPDPLAEQCDDFHRDPRFALEIGQKIIPTENEEFGGFPRRRVSGAGLTIEHRNFSEQITGTEKIQGQPPTVGRAGLDANLSSSNPEQRIPAVALLEQYLAGGDILRVAQCGNLVNRIGAQAGEKGIQPKEHRKFRLLGHRHDPRGIYAGDSKRNIDKVRRQPHNHNGRI